MMDAIKKYGAEEYAAGLHHGFLVGVITGWTLTVVIVKCLK